MKRLGNGHYEVDGTEYMSVWTYNRTHGLKLDALEVYKKAPVYIEVPTETNTSYKTVRAYTVDTLKRIANGWEYQW
tara:strand:- start:13 stop:240 length:228 start_codon:yes stop_codon:yes gene_type:complete